MRAIYLAVYILSCSYKATMYNNNQTKI